QVFRMSLDNPTRSDCCFGGRIGRSRISLALHPGYGCRNRRASRREETMPAYDPGNIFAKILRGELPCHKIYEDDKALAFLDIMPRAPGHTLVLPKAPARNLLDVEPSDLAHVMQVAQKIARATVKVF